MDAPLFHFGLTRAPRENAYHMWTFAWPCGCVLTLQSNGWHYASRWCRTHRAERDRRERERFARMKPAPATDAEVAEFLEGIGAQREGERETDRAARTTTNRGASGSRLGGARRGAATFPFILAGLGIAFTAMFGIAELGHHVREFVTVMSQFGAACAAVAR